MAVVARGAVRRPSRFRYWRQWLTAYLFLSPYLVFLLIFIAGAVVLAAYYSFTRYDLLSDPVLIGLKNYEKAMQDQSFLHALKNVAVYTVVVLPFLGWIGMGRTTVLIVTAVFAIAGLLAFLLQPAAQRNCTCGAKRAISRLRPAHESS